MYFPLVVNIRVVMGVVYYAENCGLGMFLAPLSSALQPTFAPFGQAMGIHVQPGLLAAILMHSCIPTEKPVFPADGEADILAL